MMKTWPLEGMVCSFERPDLVKTGWAFEAFKLIREFQVHAADVKAQSKNPALLKLTRKRLDHLIEHLELQMKSLAKLLDPLGWHSLDDKTVISSLNESPGPSLLSANYDNLFRDWVWGTTENEMALQRIQKVAEGIPVGGKVLVLGAGACRLAYDFHRQNKSEKTVVSDFNPLLMLAAQKIIRGTGLELVEFPTMPRSGELSAIKQTLKAEVPLTRQDGFEFHLADATQPAFEDQGFTTLITPWLIDVIRMGLPDFLPRLNAILPLGGTWINFGPLGFNNPVLAAHYSLEEVKYLAEKFGFKIKSESYEMIPYMHNPASNTHRQERVLTFAAEKIKDVGRADQNLAPLHSTWQSDPDAVIDLPVKELRLVNGHAFNLDVFTEVQNGTTFNRLVSHVGSKFGLSKDQAEFLIIQILRNAEAMARQNPLRKSAPN